MTGISGLIIFLLAIILAIVIGTKLKVNIGIVAFLFAFLIGTMLMGKTIAEVLSYFPTSLFYTLMVVSYFYGYASENGAFTSLSKWMIYALRKRLKLLPLFIYLVSFVVAATGAGAGPTPAIMAPVAFALAEQVGFSPVSAVLAVNLGVLSGGIQTWTSTGVLFSGMAEAYVGREAAIAAGWGYGFILLIIPAIFYLFVYLYYQRKTVIKYTVLDKPEPLDKRQKHSLMVIGLMLLFIIPPGFADIFFNIPQLSWFTSRFDIKVLCLIGIIINSALGLGDSRKVVKDHIPWATIVMVCGMTTMIGLVAETGVADIMGSWLGNNVHSSLILPFIIIISGLLSFITGGAAEIFALVMPMFVSLSEASGISLAALSIALYAGCGSTGMSPFSQGGAMALSGCKDEAVREKVWPRQCIASVLFMLFYAALAFTGIFEFAAGLFG